MKTVSEGSSTSTGVWGVGRTKPVSIPPTAPEKPTVPHQTERTEDASQRSELKRQALMNSMSDLVFSLRKDGTILECHVPRDGSFNFSADGLVGKRIIELLPIQIAQQAMHYLEKALRTGHRQSFTCPYLVSGHPREFEARMAPCGSTEAVAVVREVPTNRATEKEILEISHRERVRIGQDLHDGLGQHLTGITFLTKALEKKLEARSLPEAEEAAEIGRLVLQALSQTRTLARGLFPVEVESSGLVQAFRELAETVQKLFSIVCVLECEEDAAVADRTQATHLFRLAQEAINNSVKHGKAKRVAIGLKTVEGSLMLSIQDNGTGFSQEDTSSKGLGLRIMQYRAQKIGGSLEIHPAPEGGTVVICSLPQHLRKVAFGRK